jgi:GNAT superfamily N-acetyltransferase
MATMPARFATPADAAELTRLRALMLESVGATVDDAWRAACTAAFEAGLADGTYAAFVVDGDGGRLAACGVASVSQRLPSMTNRTGRVGYIHSMSTDEHHRRAGHARTVFEALMAWFAEQGIVTVELHATDMGAPLYRAYGFIQTQYAELRWHADGH